MRDAASAPRRHRLTRGVAAVLSILGIVTFTMVSMILLAATNLRDRCTDDGGVFDEEARRCLCSNDQRGTDAVQTTPRQAEWRRWCAEKTTLAEMKGSAAAPPAQTKWKD
ncbi:hypothetical protein [Parvularcula dongshanensis]|uniref:Uncharacterized protein n=1 Tax=Parvularcula dongshanensis TaxID=1173995 RepID=A0A840I0X5_9PROT|nr:hypothetical protein [Parvularcula dongshanensis]MBB4657995.1 hypothetical protein [Parvularcula dongshanensis]